jgi:Icc-related predicted phosphoesterase
MDSMGVLGSLFRSRPAEPVTRLFFASDLHGSERGFRKFLAAARLYRVDALVMGGDVIGKVAVPIIREGDGRYRARLMGRTEHLDGETALQRLTERMETLGFYGKVMDEDEYRQISGDPKKVEALFFGLALARLRSWMRLAEERLAGTGVKLYMMGGNDDYQAMMDTIAEEPVENVVHCDGRAVEIDAHHTMISAGHSTPTPWHTPREMSEEQLGTLLEDLAGRLPDASRAIFNFHVPPVDSTLDTCPQLDWTTDPPSQIVKGGQPVMFGAGSHAVRRSIESHQPLLGLHGHIHESGGVARLGRTTCVNPGSEYGEGILRGCILSLARDSVRSFQMTSG